MGTELEGAAQGVAHHRADDRTNGSLNPFHSRRSCAAPTVARPVSLDGRPSCDGRCVASVDDVDDLICGQGDEGGRPRLDPPSRTAVVLEPTDSAELVLIDVPGPGQLGHETSNWPATWPMARTSPETALRMASLSRAASRARGRTWSACSMNERREPSTSAHAERSLSRPTTGPSNGTSARCCRVRWCARDVSTPLSGRPLR